LGGGVRVGWCRAVGVCRRGVACGVGWGAPWRCVENRGGGVGVGGERGCVPWGCEGLAGNGVAGGTERGGIWGVGARAARVGRCVGVAWCGRGGEPKPYQQGGKDACGRKGRSGVGVGAWWVNNGGLTSFSVAGEEENAGAGRRWLGWMLG